MEWFQVCIVVALVKFVNQVLQELMYFDLLEKWGCAC